MEQLETSAPPDPAAPAPPSLRPRTPSVKPALVVVGIAVGLIALFGVLAALTGGAGTPPAPSSSSAPVKGATLASQPAAAALKPIVQLSTPPADVLGALVLPKGATTVSSSPWNGSTQYAAKMRFDVAASQASVLSFYKAELKSLGWSISSTGAAERQKGATEVLAQRASSDGWYWEIGVVVSPTTFGSGTDTTPFTLDLYEVPDAQ